MFNSNVVKGMKISMKKLFTIEKDTSIKVSSQITNFLEPTHVYFPITKDCPLKHKKVKKGEILYTIDNVLIKSSVSGTITKILNISGNNFLEITNNYKEEDFYEGKNELTRTGLYGNVKENFAKNSSFSNDMFEGKKILVLNGIEDEPYVASRTFLHIYEAEALLEMLDCLGNIFQIPVLKIFVKETDRESIEAFLKYNGMYENIQLEILPDYYMLGNELVLRKYAKLGEETVILHTEDVYEMYNQSIRMRSNDVIFLTVTGDMIENPQVFRVKIGTKFTELLPYIKQKNGKSAIYLNGLLKRETCDINTLILSKKTRAVFFMKPLNLKKMPCISCGKCNFVCPVEENPYRALKDKNYKPKNCISCGLCDYICPSNILVSESWKEK